MTGANEGGESDDQHAAQRGDTSSPAGEPAASRPPADETEAAADRVEALGELFVSTTGTDTVVEAQDDSHSYAVDEGDATEIARDLSVIARHEDLADTIGDPDQTD